MQNIDIKAGTSAIIDITPKINGKPIASAGQLTDVKIYVFFVYQFTSKIYDNPIILTSNDFNTGTGKLRIELTPDVTLDMLGSADKNQKFAIQFAVKTADNKILSDNTDSSIVINIIRWEAGEWIQKEQEQQS